MTRSGEDEGQMGTTSALAACYLNDVGDLWHKLGPLTPKTHLSGSGTGGAVGPRAAPWQQGKPESSDSV